MNRQSKGWEEKRSELIKFVFLDVSDILFDLLIPFDRLFFLSHFTVITCHLAGAQLIFSVSAISSTDQIFINFLVDFYDPWMIYSIRQRVHLRIYSENMKITEFVIIQQRYEDVFDDVFKWLKSQNHFFSFWLNFISFIMFFCYCLLLVCSFIWFY